MKPQLSSRRNEFQGITVVKSRRMQRLGSLDVAFQHPKDEGRVPVNRTVLVVDEDLNTLRNTETLLRHLGLDVHRATDGPEACDIVKYGVVAVVVLDLKLPGMNGFEVVRRLRSRFEAPRLLWEPRIVVVTDRQEPEVETFVLRLGADAFLRKPVAPRRLIRTVEQLLARATQGAAEAAGS